MRVVGRVQLLVVLVVLGALGLVTTGAVARAQTDPPPSSDPPATEPSTTTSTTTTTTTTVLTVA